MLYIRGLNLGLQTLSPACKIKLENWDIKSSPEDAKVALEEKVITKGSHYPQEKHVATAALHFGETGGLCIIYTHTPTPTLLSSFILSVAIKCLNLDFRGLSVCHWSGRDMQGNLQ